MSIRTKLFPPLSVVLLSAVGMVLGHWIALRFELVPGAMADGSSSDVIRARQIELVDAQGRRRASLGFSGEGSPALWFFDQGGKARLNLGVYGDGNPMIVLNDVNEQAVQIFRTVDQAPVLVMKAEGRDRIILGLSRGGDPKFEYFDAAGAHHAVFGN